MGKQAFMLCGAAAFVAFGIYSGPKRISVVHISERPANSTQIPTKFETLETLKNAAPAVPLSPDQLFAAMSPAVAQVHVMDATMMPIGQGTGFFVSTDGLLVTNWHVIEGGAAATIITPDGISHAVEGVAASNEKADLALLKVRLATDKVATLVLAPHSVPPAIGTHVFAIGNPKGLTNTLSDGLVSGHREGLDEGGGTLLQITAPISPGSSGGPLMTGDGAVVGVTSAGIFDGQNLNFAVPADDVRKLIDSRSVPIAMALLSGAPGDAPHRRRPAAEPPSDLPRGASSPIEIIAGLVNAKKYEAAMIILRDSGEQLKDVPRYWCLMARVQEEGFRNYDVAESAYRKAIALRPTYEFAHERLGHLLARRGRTEEAIDCFRTQAKINPKAAAPYRSAGVVYAEVSQPKQAIAYLDHAIKRAPDDPELRMLRGQQALSIGRDELAMADFRFVLRTHPQSSTALSGIADVHLRAGRKKEAKDAFNYVLQLYPKNPRAHLQLGRMAREEGDFEAARSAWTKVVEFDPRSMDGRAAAMELTRLQVDSSRRRATADTR